ncbi:MAG TPA: ABC transporter permease [Rhodopila sp.]|uniref:ABC transporter permease n=1 Tax=Rhodopila sp. TaxID=2480087 RepID=UPI002CBC1113|nr:ABC transporter permease [Rhodopila sp.]HVY17634.1 ABC transporter permease [Rhodopila sp.]
MRLGNVWQLGIKELRGLWRDPAMIVLIVYAFTAAVYAQATVQPETLNKAPISIVDEDRSPLSERIVSAFYPPYFTTPALITRDEMDRRMDAGIDTFALDIPPDFQRDVLAGRSPAIQLNVDATRMTQAFSGAGYVQTIVSNEISAFLARSQTPETPPVDLALRVRFNPDLTHSWFGSVMAVINSITMLAMVLTGAALIREREHGTIEHLLVMPVTAVEIMVSKIWSMGLVVFVAAFVSLLLIVQGLLHVVVQGSVALFMAASALDIAAAATMGIALATVAESMPQFGLLIMLVLLPLQVLSGGMTPRESMPEIVQNLMLLAPNTHFVILAQAILFRGAGFDLVWPQFLTLFGIAAALFGFALWRFRGFLR